MQFAPFAIGAMSALLAMDYVPLAAKRIAERGSVSAAVEVPAQLVNRATKSDRLGPVNARRHAIDFDARHAGNVSDPARIHRPVVRDVPQERTRPATTTPARTRAPVGCDPLFSPVAEPAMAHYTGRCIS